MFDHQLLRSVSAWLNRHHLREYYLFRNPEDPLPPLRHPNVVHKVNALVPQGRLYLVDARECAQPWLP